MCSTSTKSGNLILHISLDDDLCFFIAFFQNNAWLGKLGKFEKRNM